MNSSLVNIVRFTATKRQVSCPRADSVMMVATQRPISQLQPQAVLGATLQGALTRSAYPTSPVRGRETQLEVRTSTVWRSPARPQPAMPLISSLEPRKRSQHHQQATKDTLAISPNQRLRQLVEWDRLEVGHRRKANLHLKGSTRGQRLRYTTSEATTTKAPSGQARQTLMRRIIRKTTRMPAPVWAHGGREVVSGDLTRSVARRCGAN